MANSVYPHFLLRQLNETRWTTAFAHRKGSRPLYLSRRALEGSCHSNPVALSSTRGDGRTLARFEEVEGGLGET